MSERDNPLLEQFIPDQNKVGLVELRPITAQSLVMLYLTKNALVNKPQEHEMLYCIAAFIYLHSEDPKKIYSVVRDEALYFEAVNEFCKQFKHTQILEAIPVVQLMIQKAFVGQDFTVEQNAPDPN